MKALNSGSHFYRLLAVALSTLILAACGGTLAYRHSDTVFLGPLDNNLNIMKSSGALDSIDSFNDMQYAIDSGGSYVGICRTLNARPNGNSTPTDGTMELRVYNLLRQQTLSLSQDSLAKKIDSFASTNYESLIDGSWFIFFDCDQVGASNTDSNLVLYLQLQGTESLAQNTAVELDVSGTSATVVDVELYSRHSAPVRVIARSNPLNGHTVGISGGKIEIDGAPVLLNGNPVNADSVKHHFK